MNFNFLPKENLEYFLGQIKNKLDSKVDKADGKALSTNDLTNSLKASYDDAANKKHTHANKTVLDNTTASFTTEEKTKLAGIAAGAQTNVQSDWNETTTSAAAFIKNKPIIPSATSQLKNDSDYVTSGFVTNALEGKVDVKEGWGLSENNLTAALITKINNADTKAHTHSNYATLENIEEAYTTAEKTKLKNIEAGAQVNLITGVKGSSETEYRTGNVNITKANIGLGNVDNTTDANKPVSTAQQKAIDAAYTNSNKYTDQKIADLIGGAPETMDTLKEVSDAIAASKSVEEALNNAIGTKANQTELDTHTGNDTIHITATERTNWNDANSKKHTHSNKTTLDGITADKVTSWDKVSNKLDTDGNASNTTVAFSVAAARTNLTTGEKISASFGKIAKWFSDLKTVAFSGSYNDLSDTPTIPTSLPANGGNAATVNGHTVESDVPENAKFTDTNTWRDVVDNLSSARTDASLSANQGRILGAKLPFALGIDADGNYGYYKVGADTVTPFKTNLITKDEYAFLPQVYLRSTHPKTNYFLIDVTDIDTLYYYSCNQGSGASTIYGYTQYDYDDAEGRSDPVTLATISAVDTVYYWSHELDVSSYQVVQFCGGSAWGGIALTAGDNQHINKIRMISAGGWSEMSYLVPISKRLKITAIDVTKAIIMDQRLLYRLNEGYGHKTANHSLGDIEISGRTAICPVDFKYGRYVWVSGNTTSASGTYSADVELIDYDEDNLTNKFIDYTCSIENSSYRTLSIDSNMALVIHRTQTLACTCTWWSEIPINRGDYTKVEVEVTLDQQGDGSNGYTNIIGISDHYPGESYLSTDGGGIYPIVNYDTDYLHAYVIGNDIFEKKTLTFDISDLNSAKDLYLKITAGNAGFIVHSIRLKK